VLQYIWQQRLLKPEKWALSNVDYRYCNIRVIVYGITDFGFMDLEARNIALTGARSNSAASFLLVITGLHMLHVLGGVIA
jgi:hypothetical protein